MWIALQERLKPKRRNGDFGLKICCTLVPSLNTHTNYMMV